MMKSKELKIQPWELDNDIVGFGQNSHDLNQEMNSKPKPKLLPKEYRTSLKKQQKKGSLKHQIINFARKTYGFRSVSRQNMNLQSYNSYLKNANYTSLFHDEQKKFIPIQATNFKAQQKPAYKPNCISFTRESKYQSSIRKNEFIAKEQSFPRPKTTSMAEICQKSSLKSPVKSAFQPQLQFDDEQIFEHFYEDIEFQTLDKKPYHPQTHLQKVLKIRERLRQKIKRAGKKKQKERNTILEKHNPEIIYSPQFLIPKNTNPNRKKKQVSVDKWKMKMKSKSSISTRIDKPFEKMFLVQGSSIRK